LTRSTLVVGTALLAWTLYVVGSGPTLRALGELCGGLSFLVVGFVWAGTVAHCRWSADGAAPAARGALRSPLLGQAVLIVLVGLLAATRPRVDALPWLGGVVVVLALVALGLGALARSPAAGLLHPWVVLTTTPVLLYSGFWLWWSRTHSWAPRWGELHFTAALTVALAGGAYLVARRSGARHPPPEHPRVDPVRAGAAVLPLLVPSACVAAVRWGPAAPTWQPLLAPHGQAALLFVAGLAGLLPAAVHVAIGLEALLGRRPRPWVSPVATGALVGLALSGPACARAVRTLLMPGLPEDDLSRLSALFVLAPLLLLACSTLVRGALVRLAAGRAGPWGPGALVPALLLPALLLAGARWGGPVGVLVGALVGVGLAWGVLVRAPRARQLVEHPSVLARGSR